MGTKRDDFTLDTIRRAAGRVGYRCSFPGCLNTTIGASMESSDKTSITGVAAHICAAAEGGPRYDKNMTVNERRGVENCIWLCQTHSKLIDTDTKTYTVEKLRSWKSDAELAASRALANGDYLAEYYKSNENNLDILNRIFDDMIIEGQFALLSTILNQYQTRLSEQYEEFVLRYKIIYDVYCDRLQLSKHLEKYCQLTLKSGVDALVELFLSFHLKDELCQVIEFCLSEPLKKYATMALNDELINLLIAPAGSSKIIEIPNMLSKVISKYITNYIIQNKILGAINVTGERYAVFSDEFYYRCITSAYGLACATIYGKGNFEDIIASSDFVFIQENIHKINFLDTSLQEYIWSQFLAFLSENPKMFDVYYKQCSESLQKTPSIERTTYIYKISCDAESVDCDALLEYVTRSNEDAVLCIYLSCIEKSNAIEFLDEHGFLYKKSSIYIKIKLDLLSNIQPQEACEFLKKYEKIYTDNFTFHLLSAKYTNSVQRLNEEIEWLNTNQDKMMFFDTIDYIFVLRQNRRWEDLIKFSKISLPNEHLFAIAGYLSESNKEDHLKTSRDIYQKLINIGWKRKWLHFNIGIIQKQLGDFENAKISFQNEYDLYSHESSLLALIQLRYSLNEYLTDYYFEQLKKCVDATSQNLIAAIYMKLCNYTDARKYFLRSLLLNDTDNPSINGFCQAISHLPREELTLVKENVFCVLKNNTRTCYIAIHDADIMENITSPNEFANYKHYSSQDVKITSLIFATTGDSVIFDNETYELIKITSANDAIRNFFFSTLCGRKDITAISCSNPENLKEQLSVILKKSSESLENIIAEYNQQELRIPLSILAHNIGRSRLKVSEFLAFENKEKIRNNLAITDCEEKMTFVLSYETIVYLAHLGIDSTMIKELCLTCSYQVRNQLLNDINDELSELTDDNRKASMFYEGGNLSMLEHTPNIRRGRYTFLTRLKALLDSIHISNNSTPLLTHSQNISDKAEELFSNQLLYCESTSLGIAQSAPSAILVTDDQFLYTLANIENIPNIGLTGLLAQSNLDWNCLLSASKNLKDMNFGNYLPIHLYKQIVDQIPECDSDIAIASEDIQNWIICDTESSATAYHEDIIISLFKEVIKQDLDYLNPGNFLTSVVASILEKRKPGFIKKCIDNAIQALKGLV